MKPPKCAVCGEKFRMDKKEGALLAFKLSPEEIMKKEEMQKKNYLGHPISEVWFCNKHLILAKKYKHLSVIEAFKEIRKHKKTITQKMKNCFYSFFK